jgi:acyl carrier protein
MPVLFFQNINNMTREEAMTEFKKVLRPYTGNKEKLESLTDKTDLIKDLQINSANLVDIIIDAESNYHIEIDNDSVEKMINVGSCLDVILDKINRKHE